jgi:quercetin dioxygenase-like cupin family protein
MDTNTLQLTPKDTVRIRRSEPDRLEVEVSYSPGGSPPPAHFHPDQDECFELLSGELEARIDGERRTLRAGDVVRIGRGSVHSMWNPNDMPVRALWVTQPRGRTESWYRELDDLQRSDRVDDKGMPSPLAFAVYLTEYSDVFQLAARPRALVSAALRALAVVGRRRGYSPSHAAR